MVALSEEEEVEERDFLDTLGPLDNQRSLSYLRVLTAPDPKVYTLPSGHCTSPLHLTVIRKNRASLFDL